jgi:hypothetical protein
VATWSNIPATSKDPMPTEGKKTGDLAYLNEVSPVPLQQAPRHLRGRSPSVWRRAVLFVTAVYVAWRSDPSTGPT